jgi:hypothetical protein
MKVFAGIVTTGYGIAARNLDISNLWVKGISAKRSS